MINLDDLMIFDAKKSSRNLKNKVGIYFSLTKNSKGYVGVRFYFDKAIADKYGINEDVKIKLACGKDNSRHWYLMIGTDGYTLRADKKESSFSCLMNFPFDFVENKRMQFISEEDIKFYEENKILAFSVESVFSEEDLKLTV
ncbi:MAG: hypothetical protein K0R14_790 [Burkholderiales bacterium]|jgi:hypothetical protein|nr:hypothetical protein [Burkholderiales bacterium]